jgi:hypothetical protein
MSFLKTFAKWMQQDIPTNKASLLLSPTQASPTNQKNEESNMLENLLTAFKSEFGLGQAGNVLTSLHGIIQGLEANYVKDGSARNAAIDSISQYLLSLKTTAAPVTPVTPVTPAT